MINQKKKKKDAKQVLNKCLEIGYFSGQTLLMLEQILSEIYVPVISVEETIYQNEKKNKKAEGSENENGENGENGENYNEEKPLYNKESSKVSEDMNKMGSMELSESDESLFISNQNLYNENNNNSGFLLSMEN